ncbi:hypothetical protein G8764_13595 [Pseudomaricurvus alcaniphilus]|uniref:hypothetical protein n=1 Tax=Pseudomaricurvus alcaniphilus TaxID=1166482 RepID=UPI00140C14ED|nr:hypothetical protein [Pseudomaricurvus alcaniphilus]NHN38337.1 hypothetical protein [Pseudomaricurvus alcaniphilus]
MAELTDKSATLIGLGSSKGHAVVNKHSPLRRLNYFDGKFIRAPDLILEQQALLNQIRLGNRAGGAGVVYGYDCTLSGNDGLNISAGYAIDPQGKALLLGDGISVGIGELIEKSTAAAFGPTASSAGLGRATATAGFSASSAVTSSMAAAAVQKNISAAQKSSAVKKAGFDDCVIHNSAATISAGTSDQLYLITLNHTEAYCGEEDVYGKLCSEACSTSTNRSYIIEGVEVRAVPINLSQLYKNSAAVDLSAVHLRSRVASAYFEQERQLIASHISASGLSSSIWCLGAEASGGNGVPIAIIGRNGSTTLFLDAWTARRERMEAPPRHYWAGRMAMRPWQQFLAQILQFQCQLRACLTSTDPNAPCKTLREFDPCASTRKIAGEAAAGMRYLLDSLGRMAGQLSDLQALNINNATLAELQGGSAGLEAQYQKLIDVARVVLPEQLLINCGIVEVPSAGYLPVNASSTITVNEQVRRFFGDGVDLRFCVTRADYIPHALEEAQHMERICLLSGLDNAANKPKVDVLVPEGEIQQLEAQVVGTGYQSTTSISTNLLAIGWPRKLSVAADVAGNSAIIGSASNLNVSAARLSTNLEAFRLAEGLRVNIARSLPPLSGAARGEQLDNGGTAFYLAARSTASVIGSGSLSLANAASNSVLSLLNQGRSDAAASGARAAINVSTNIEALTGVGRVPTLAPSTAVWASLKTNRDPFTLASGDSCDVQAHFLLVSSRRLGDSNQTTVSERSINGQLQIQKGAPQAAQTKLTARLVANGIWSDTTVTDGQSQERTEAVKLNETIVISRRPVVGLPPTINMTISNPSFFAGLGNIQLVAERIWTSPTASTFRLLLRRQDIKAATAGLTLARADGLVAEEANLLVNRAAELQALNPASNDDILLECNLTEDSNVLSAGNSWHTNSLQALSTLEKASGEKGFSDSAQQRLFPPPQPVADELSILARLPWVLFHRRRDKICQSAVAAEVLQVARHYRVYHVHLDADTNVEQLLALLQRDVGGTLASLKPRPVSTIEFAPGIALVATAHGDVRADWQARVQVTADIQLALIASEGEVINEGEALAESRLQSLTNVLDPVSELAEGFQTLSVNEVPDTLASAEVDGIIVYFTRSVATICHTVYRVLSNNADAFIEELGGYLGNSGGESLPSYVQRRGGQPLSASPRFFTDGDTFFGASEAAQLDASWDVLNDGPVSHVLTLAADESAEQQVVSRQQASRISQTVGTDISADSVQYLAASANLLKPCPKATLLIAATQCNDLYFYTPPVAELPPLVKQLQEFIQGSGLTSEILGSGVNTGATRTNLFTHFRTVDFYAASSQFETGSRDNFSVAWQSELGGNSPASLNAVLMCVARTGATDADTEMNLKLAQEQGLKLRSLMGLGQVQVVGAVNNPEVAFPVACEVLTLLVVARAANFGLMDTTHFAAVTTSSNRQPGADSDSGGTDDATAAQPELTVELANGVRFNENNEVIRDAAFNAAVERARERETPIDTIEVISVDAAPDPAAEARANALLGALRESGAASDSASVTVRSANERERAEIVRSGFVLNRGIVLR